MSRTFYALGLRAWDSVAKGDEKTFSNMGAPARPQDCPEGECGACLYPLFIPLTRGNPPPVTGAHWSPEPPAWPHLPRASRGLPPAAPHLSAALAASQWPEPWASAATSPTLGPRSRRLHPLAPAALVNKTRALEQPAGGPAREPAPCAVALPGSPGQPRGDGGGRGDSGRRLSFVMNR